MRRRNPAQVGPDQRYWRSRANRRVRTARRKINVLRWLLVLAVNGVLATAVYYSVRWTVDYLTTTEEFAVQRIEVDGTRRASPEALRSRVAEGIRGNILDLDLDSLEQTVRQDPWVLEATVRRVLPDTLYVDVIERTPTALAEIGDRTYVVDATGYVVGPTDPGGEHARLPLLDGLATEDREALRLGLERGVAAIDRLRRSSEEFARGVARIDLARDDRISVTLSDGGPTILLDPARVEQNVRYYMELRPAIQRRVGSADYIDLRWRDRISVMPANHTPQGRSR